MRIFSRFSSAIAFITVTGFLALGMASNASATVSGYAGVTFSSANIGTEQTLDDPSTVGWSFTLNGSRTLTSLGLYNTSFDVPATVSLWNSSGTMLATAVFNMSDISNLDISDLGDSNFLWQSLNSVALSAGTYTIGAFSNGKHYAVLDATPSATSGLQITAGLIHFGNTNAKPDEDFTALAPHGFFGPNLRFAEAPSAVPVPGAVWLLGSGLLGLFGLKRVKKTA